LLAALWSLFAATGMVIEVRCVKCWLLTNFFLIIFREIWACTLFLLMPANFQEKFRLSLDENLDLLGLVYWLVWLGFVDSWTLIIWYGPDHWSCHFGLVSFISVIMNRQTYFFLLFCRAIAYCLWHLCVFDKCCRSIVGKFPHTPLSVRWMKVSGRGREIQ